MRLAAIVSEVLLASCTTTTIIVNPPADSSNDATPSPATDASGVSDVAPSDASFDATMTDALFAQADATSDVAPAFEAATTPGDATGPVSADAAGDSAASVDGAVDRGARCDPTGMNCRCFNVASLGYGGHIGVQSGAAGSDTTEQLLGYLSSQSNAAVAQLGCGVDTGCPSAAKPDLSDPAFLPSYDVLLFQWMASSLKAVTSTVGAVEGYEGASYWTFSQAELDALKAWVVAGGGVIVLTGYDYLSDELGPPNQILGALTDISLTATDTYGATQTGNAEFCLGDSDPVTGWAPAPDALGQNIRAVGAFHGRTIQPGANAVVDCQDATYGVCAAHEDVGRGHVYVFTDEWVTYTSQWNPSPEPATYCSLDGSTQGGDFPAVQAAYQVPQFWYNAIRYASQASGCPFSLTGAIAN